MKKNVRNVEINYGVAAFYTDSMAVIHTSDKFVIDFRQTIPKLDQIENSRQETIYVEHNSVVMNPYIAKMLMNLLKDNIEKYEKKFGEIKIVESKSEKEEKFSTKDFGYIA